MIDVEKKLLFVNSDNASLQVSNSNFIITVPQNFIETSEMNEHIDLQLVEATTRYDFYAVNEKNDRFSIFYNGTDHFYSIQRGFPSSLTITSELKTDLQAETGEVWSVTYSSYTGRLSITSDFSNAVPSDLALNFNVENSVANVLGFSEQSYPFTIVGQNVSLTSPQSIDMNGNNKNIFIKISPLVENYDVIPEGIQPSFTLAKIPIVVQPFNVINFFDSNNLFRQRLAVKRYSNIEVRITDEQDNLIPLETNFLMTLKFIKVRDDSKVIPDLIEKQLQMERMKTLRKITE